MSIVTKTGDKGTTSLFDGTRIKKNHPKIVASGELDELSCFVGLASSLSVKPGLQEALATIQDELSTLCSHISRSLDNPQTSVHAALTQALERVETQIAKTEDKHGAPQGFIRPGGSAVSASLHVARAVCRRAERNLVHLAASDTVDDSVLKYLNRLSDYLFLLAEHPE